QAATPAARTPGLHSFWRADVVLALDSSGAAVQRAWYTAYGVPTGADRADLNGDGVVDSSDASIFGAWHGASDVRADWNLDGTINSTDTIAYLNAYNSAVTFGGRGVLSSAALDLRAGYAGYRWDAITERYHVRHRVYEPYLGVWQSRDPIEYFGDSYNLHEYVGSRATVWRDPLGLQVAPQPVVPHDDRPHRAPYDIFPGESIESIIKKQRDAIQDAGRQKPLNTPTEAMDCCFTVKQGYQDATDGSFKDDWDGILREAKDGITNIGSQYATAGLVCGITGFTRHGLNRAISRGVKPCDILDSVRCPTEVVKQSGGRTKYIGRKAVTILNKDGKVITVWPQS
ncbi:MAG: hypothetical protein KJZ54_05330, partial [Phycisphaerales bacterium]|nr:hypothetical protein [Phycisphaerales bacterium]